MCGASKLAKDWDDAEQGATLGIASVGIDNGKGKKIDVVGGFHRPGEAIANCVMCVQDGTKLTISNIGANLQAKFGIDAMAVAEFIERDWHEGDALGFENGHVVPLLAFADNNVTAFVGIKQATEPTLKVKEGPAIRSHTGVLETHVDGQRATG